VSASLFQNIDVYTQQMNGAFTDAYDGIAEFGPMDAALTRVPSTGRVENYLWLYPPPMMHLWRGYREFAKAATKKYTVENLTYTVEQEMPVEDLDDAQLPGFKRLAGMMAENAKLHELILLQQNLANGQSVACFDGSSFFATSHNLGTGNNIVTGTAAATDGVTHAGDNVSSLNRKIQWWADMRGAAAFGFWYDAVLVKWANTPTISEFGATLANVQAAMGVFTYPKNMASDPDVFIHATLEPDAGNSLMVCSSKLAHIGRQATSLGLIGATENAYKGFTRIVSSGYLNAVV
jgi:hypothetical protein